MTLTATDRGNNGNTTTATTWSFVPLSTCTAGAPVFIFLAYNNSGTDGADPFVSLADNKGNTYTSLIAALNDPGAANEGLCLRVWVTYQDGGQLKPPADGGDAAITVTFSVNTQVKVFTAVEVTSDTGTPTVVGSSSATGSSTTPSITTPSIPIGDLVIGVAAHEYGTNTITPDSDATNGTWSTHQTNTRGSGGTGLNISTQQKIQTTAASTQTFNQTRSQSSEWIAGYVQVTDDTGGPSPSTFVAIII